MVSETTDIEGFRKVLREIKEKKSAPPKPTRELNLFMGCHSRSGVLFVTHPAWHGLPSWALHSRLLRTAPVLLP